LRTVSLSTPTDDSSALCVCVCVQGNGRRGDTVEEGEYRRTMTFLCAVSVVAFCERLGVVLVFVFGVAMTRCDFCGFGTDASPRALGEEKR